MAVDRKYPIGAEVAGDGKTHFRLWAPECKRVEVVLEPSAQRLPMEAEGGGHYSLVTDRAADGSLYRFLLDGEGPFPDPASRFQPEGPHGPSQVVDPHRFTWTDQSWKGAALPNQVLYEMHIGTFTQEGTWAAAAGLLPELAQLGVTCLEVMPIADFPGKFGWGYDGVNMFAPTRLYGGPDDARRFVDAAHALGMGVLLDVVYNHIGPDGNYLERFAKDYFTDTYKTDWGRAINYDGPNSEGVRDFFTANAAYWIDEYHIDGLRLDATQNIYDDAEPSRHILTEIGRAVRRAANGRSTILINENEPQHSELVRKENKGGFGLDALWNDDYHHSAAVALTGKTHAYYKDYRGDPQEFISAIKYGYLYQGQWYSWQKQGRGHSALDLSPAAFVNFLENHDQIANSAHGLRMHQLSSPARYRALHALTLLAPGTPMLFQGQEFATTSPFLYFADHNPDLASMVKKGRLEFLEQFPGLKDPRMADRVAAPHDPDTFQRCKLDHGERTRNAAAHQLTKDLLHLRRTDPAFRAQKPRGLDGAVLGQQAFVLRFFVDDGMDRLVVVNLGRDLDLATSPEPLLAPPAGCHWTVAFSTEFPRYGGGGVVHPDTGRGWFVTGESTIVLVPEAGVAK